MNQLSVFSGTLSYEFRMQIRRRALWITFLSFVLLILMRGRGFYGGFYGLGVYDPWYWPGYYDYGYYDPYYYPDPYAYGYGAYGYPGYYAPPVVGGVGVVIGSGWHRFGRRCPYAGTPGRRKDRYGRSGALEGSRRGAAFA